MSLIDPPREGVHDAVKKCRTARIRVSMASCSFGGLTGVDVVGLIRQRAHAVSNAARACSSCTKKIAGAAGFIFTTFTKLDWVKVSGCTLQR